MDKIHFYREMQTIDLLDDLENIIDDLKQLNNSLLDTEAENFLNY